MSGSQPDLSLSSSSPFCLCLQLWARVACSLPACDALSRLWSAAVAVVTDKVLLAVGNVVPGAHSHVPASLRKPFKNSLEHCRADTISRAQPAQSASRFHERDVRSSPQWGWYSDQHGVPPSSRVHPTIQYQLPPNSLRIRSQPRQRQGLHTHVSEQRCIEDTWEMSSAIRHDRQGIRC